MFAHNYKFSKYFNEHFLFYIKMIFNLLDNAPCFRYLSTALPGVFFVSAATGCSRQAAKQPVDAKCWVSDAKIRSNARSDQQWERQRAQQQIQQSDKCSARICDMWWRSLVHCWYAVRSYCNVFLFLLNGMNATLYTKLTSRERIFVAVSRILSRVLLLLTRLLLPLLVILN